MGTEVTCTVILRALGRARKEAPSKRTEGDQANSQLAKDRNDPFLEIAFPDRILALQGRDRLHGVSAADCVVARFRHTEIEDFALGDHILNCPRNIFNRNIGVHTVLIKEVNAVRAQSSKRSIHDFTNMVRSAVSSCSLTVLQQESKFCSDRDCIATVCEGAASNSSFLNGPYASAVSKNVQPSSMAR